MEKENQLHILVNLPPTFFTDPHLVTIFDRLKSLGEVRTASHNTVEEMLGDLPWAQAVIMWAWPILDESILSNYGTNLVFMGQINATQKSVLACLNRGIAISEARHCWSPAVAEMALGLILSGLRKISHYHIAMLQGKENWVINFPADIDENERELTGKTVGIVGFGGIGQRLAKLLEPFRVKLLIYDPFLPVEIAQKFDARHVEIKEMVKICDVVVLAAANNEGSRHSLGRDEIFALKNNSVLVNVGRSMLVDMKALVERLTKGDLIAMLDVYDQEPLPVDSELRNLPNAFLTPHRAGGIMSSVERALTMLTDDLIAYIHGEKRKYAATREMLFCFTEGK